MQKTSVLFKVAHATTAFNACSCLMFCDETLVSLGHKILVINEYASVHNPPKKRSSSDSLMSELKSGKIGRGSPKTSRKKQKDSAEDSNTTNKMLQRWQIPLKTPQVQFQNKM